MTTDKNLSELSLDEQIEALEEMLGEESSEHQRRAITRALKDVRQQKARREWQEKWPADGDVPPENDSLTAKPEKKGGGEKEADTPALYVRVDIDPGAQPE